MNQPRSAALVSLLKESGLLGKQETASLTQLEPVSVIENLLGTEAAVDGEALAQFLAVYMDLDYLPEEAVAPEEEIRPALALLVQHGLNAVPLRAQGSSMLVAVANPLDVALADRLAAILQTRVRLVVASLAALHKAKANHVSSHVRLQMESQAFRQSGAAAVEEAREDLRDAAPVVRLIDSLLRTAVERGASDVHIETMQGNTHMRFRIDGVLQPAMEPISATLHDSIVTRIKVLAQLDIAERRAPQDGRFTFVVDRTSIDFRVSILPGEKEGVVLRLLRHVDLSDNRWRLDELGFPETLVSALRRSVHAPQGLVLLSGPTGSGKTTTLYAAISEINHRLEKVITIEDPVEYRLDGIMQLSVNERKFTFANGLRSILRHDPDKIMIGEIRDRETAEIAIQSSLTGHLVLSTVHANGAAEAVNRFVQIGVNRTFVLDALIGVFAQRLVRVLCPACKIPDASGAVLNDLPAHEHMRLAGQTIFCGTGCPQCNFTGYCGREAIGEFIRFTPELKDALLEEGGAGMRAVARKAISQTLRGAAIDKVFLGHTSLEEANRVTFAD